MGLFEMNKVYSTLKQIVREWSVDGRIEREHCYGIVVKEILNLFENKK